MLEALEDGAIRVALEGKLDVATAPKDDRALRAAQACASLVVLDLRRIEFIGATAAGIILAADARARQARGRLVVVPGPPPPRPISQLDRLYRRVETIAQPPEEGRGRGRHEGYSELDGRSR